VYQVCRPVIVDLAVVFIGYYIQYNKDGLMGRGSRGCWPWE
jgi:hypothetical protein